MCLLSTGPGVRIPPGRPVFALTINNIMSALRDKINNRIDELEKLLGNQKHLTNPDLVIEQIESITKFWSILKEEDKDYVECARFALETRSEWKHD